MSALGALSTRASSLCVLVLAIAGALAGTAPAQTVRLKSRIVAQGLNRPVMAVSPPGDPRLFIVEHGGRIKILKNGSILPMPFLDIDSIVGGGTAGQETGLLGLAFHPNYAVNRRFYVSFTNNSDASVVREYRADPSNPDVAISSSFVIILPAVAHFGFHNGGHVEFGLDGKLYLGIGDGGYSQNAQSLSSYLGKLLRFDVDNPPTYVAAGNPFAASSRPLIWSYGWRNPWRFSIDRWTGDLYAADVGDGMREEIDFQPGSSMGGENYGWRCMEGTLCSGQSTCTCYSSGLKAPIHEYPTPNGCAVIGGYVYRGNAIPAFRGHYLYADYCSNKIWSFRYSGSAVTSLTDRTGELNTSGQQSILGISGFGQDAQNELYICSLLGRVHRIESTVCPSPTKYCVRTPNSANPVGAVIGWAGSGNMTANNLVLKAWNCPPNSLGLFLYSQGRAQTPYGNGIRCVANGFRTTPHLTTNASGLANYAFNVYNPPGVIVPGSVWDFQFWFRDVAAGGSGFDLTDGLEVTFCAN